MIGKKYANLIHKKKHHLSWHVIKDYLPVRQPGSTPQPFPPSFSSNSLLIGQDAVMAKYERNVYFWKTRREGIVAPEEQEDPCGGGILIF